MINTAPTSLRSSYPVKQKSSDNFIWICSFCVFVHQKLKSWWTPNNQLDELHGWTWKSVSNLSCKSSKKTWIRHGWTRKTLIPNKPKKKPHGWTWNTHNFHVQVQNHVHPKNKPKHHVIDLQWMCVHQNHAMYVPSTLSDMDVCVHVWPKTHVSWMCVPSMISYLSWI